MRCLFLTPAVPHPPTSGAAIRNYGIIRGLSDAGYQMSLLSFGEQPAPESPLYECCGQIICIPAPTRTTTDRLRDLILTGQPDIARRLASDAFESALRDLLTQQHFDLIQFEGIELGRYLPLLRDLAPDSIISFDAHNAEAALQQTIYETDRRRLKRLPAAVYSWIQARRIRIFEGDLCRQSDSVIAVSPEDAASLNRYIPDRTVTCVPNGIFIDDYAQPDSQMDLPRPSLVFTGKMDYRPNVDAMRWFAEAILPHLPDAHLTIVGQKPHPRLLPLKDHERIMLTGWVESIVPYLHAADVFVVPLRMGSGTRLKILQAMAAGCTIVSTTTGAAGLNRSARNSLYLADDAQTMIHTIQDLLSDPTTRRQAGETAQQAVRQHYDWSVLIPDLLSHYEGVHSG